MASPGSVNVVPWGFTEFFTEIHQFLLSLERQYGIANEASTEYAVDRLAVCFRGVSHLCSIIVEAEEEASDLSDYLSNLQLLCSVLSSLWEEYEETLESAGGNMSYTALLDLTGGLGRPRFDISSDQVEYLRSLSFSWTDIASLLGVSCMIVYRRRAECSMLVEQRDLLMCTYIPVL
jgi:hypothetical protein